MVFLLLSLIGGLTFLAMGAESLVRGSATLAHRAGISQLLVGLTLVAWGTSLPEFVTMLQSVAAGTPGLALGNMVGANIILVFLILGLTAVIQPLKFEIPSFRSNILFLLLITIAAVGVFIQFNPVPHLIGAIALALLSFHTWSLYRHEKSLHHRAPPLTSEYTNPRGPLAHPFIASLLVAAGLIGLSLGASLLVDAATQLASIFHLSPTIIGLTVVSIGTTLPELFTSISAALNKQPQLAIGSAVGSCIFNLLAGLGTATLFSPLHMDASITHLSMWAMLAAAGALAVYGYNGRLGRAEGLLFLAAYVVYLGLLL